eukprot:3076470-Rhodomonas_salina.2
MLGDGYAPAKVHPPPLSAYAFATRCPVLTDSMVVSTDAFATRNPVLTDSVVISAYCVCFAMFGTDIAYPPSSVICNVRDWHSTSTPLSA